jgi:hypothetical protein
MTRPRTCPHGADDVAPTLRTLYRAIDATRPHHAGIAHAEHAAFVAALAPALVAAVADAAIAAFVDVDDDAADPWGVTVCVDFVDARDVGPVVFRYAVPEWQRGTCAAAHGGFDPRMARVEWATDGLSCLTFTPPRDVVDAIFDRVHDAVERAGEAAMRSRAAAIAAPL